MENNWKEIAEDLLNKELADDKLNSGLTGEVVDVILQCMNLVFEAAEAKLAKLQAEADERYHRGLTMLQQTDEGYNEKEDSFTFDMITKALKIAAGTDK